MQSKLLVLEYFRRTAYTIDFSIWRAQWNDYKITSKWHYATPGNNLTKQRTKVDYRLHYNCPNFATVRNGKVFTSRF